MLTIEKLSKTYHRGTANEHLAIDDLDLRLKIGSFLTVIGTPGAGRRTLSNLIAGNLMPDAGKIICHDRDITAMSECRRSQYIRRVFPSPSANTAPDLTVEENLLLALLRRPPCGGLTRLITPSRRNDLREYLHELNSGLENSLSQNTGELSDDQRQIMAIVMATMAKPELLLLDHPAAFFDPKTNEVLIRLIARLISRDSITAILFTDSMHQAIRLGDRLIIMHRGQIAEDIGSPHKQHLRPNELGEKLDELMRLEALDAGTAKMLEKLYI